VIASLSLRGNNIPKGYNVLLKVKEKGSIGLVVSGTVSTAKIVEIGSLWKNTFVANLRLKLKRRVNLFLETGPRK